METTKSKGGKLKIIAEIPERYGNKKLLVEATETELAHLCGYYHKNEGKCQDFKVGVTVKISEMFEQLYRLKMAQGQVEAASKTLHSIANLVLIINPMIEEVINPKEQKEE
jgi:hypothetical protein